MLDVKKFFPKNVWFHTRNGWASRPATKADWLKRELYLAEFLERREAKESS